MKNFDMKQIRNIAFVGSSGVGKTTLAENMLFNSKATTRIGKVEDGNTVLDFDSEEIEKGMSLSLAVAHLEWKNHMINLIDTPGIADFTGDKIAACTATDTVVIVANAAGGFEIGLEQTLELIEDKKLPKAIIINRMDNEHADYDKLIEAIQENSNIVPAPVYIPVGKENSFQGIVDIIKEKAFIKDKATEIPAELKDTVEEAKLKLTEAVAETSEELMEKYFEEGSLSQQELIQGLKDGVKKGEIIPIFTCSANQNIGVNSILDAIVEYLPSPQDVNKKEVIESGEKTDLVCSPDGKLVAYVFKSIADQVIGDLAYVRVFSGVLKPGVDVFVPEKDNKDKVGSMYFVMGKNRSDTQELKAGEIGGLVKLKVARGLNTITGANSKLQIEKPELPTPVYWKRIKAVNQSDEDKIGTALTKLLDEDPTVNSEFKQETSENILSGIGELQINLIQKRLRARFKIECELQDPKIGYKETIQGKADVSYKHKKQSGGRGQYGEVYFRINPLPRGEGYQFINSIVGGTIPSKFIPAIEKGLNETMSKGIIAGYHVVDISVDCYFGSFHDVDSSEMAFKIAASQALKKGFKDAKPILLEPVHEMQVIIPQEYMGDVMGDISTRRGKILGMEQKGRKQILNAHIPLSELYPYFPNLKSLTQGRGRFTQKFSHFEKLPDELAAKVVSEFNDAE